MKHTPSKVLICGLGSIGQRYFRLIRDTWPAIQLGVLRSGLGRSPIAEANPNAVFNSMEKALEWQPNAALICTPATCHLAQALTIANHSIPVLIEKPIGTGFESQADWASLIGLSQKVPILVGYVLRFDSALQWVSSQINDNKIGRIISADFYCSSWLPLWRKSVDYRFDVSARSELGGGVLLELSHDIDLASWLITEKLQLSSALLSNSGLLDLDVEDQATLVCTTKLNSLVTIRLSFCCKKESRGLVISGTDGQISCNILNGKTELATYSGDTIAFCIQTSADDRFLRQLNHFFDCINGVDSPGCTVSEGLDVLELLTSARVNSSSRLNN